MNAQGRNPRWLGIIMLPTSSSSGTRPLRQLSLSDRVDCMWRVVTMADSLSDDRLNPDVDIGKV